MDRYLKIPEDEVNAEKMAELLDHETDLDKAS